MAVEFDFRFEWDKDNAHLDIVRSFESGNCDRHAVAPEIIQTIEEECRYLDWRSEELGRRIGTLLFELLNGDRDVLRQVLADAENCMRRLVVNVITDGPARLWPFELLFDKEFLVPTRLDLIRRVDGELNRQRVKAEDRPLKMLFMACAPLGVEPALDFEREEDAFYRFTAQLPVHIDVEDTGSLEGLEERLGEDYDVIHLSGHADVDGATGSPFFLMEDELGQPRQVDPNDLFTILSVNPPRLLFLSGCRTGQAPDDEATYSLASQLAMKGLPAVIGWGLPVSDASAIQAGRKFYLELGHGNDIVSALYLTRRFLFRENIKDWCLLRLEANGYELDAPLVKKGQAPSVAPQQTVHATLEGTQVKVLERGFIGRRRQIQSSLRILKQDKSKIGLLIHGTGGLGKSCLAGKLCQRLTNHKLIVIHGVLNSITLLEAFEKSFQNAGDIEGLNILEQASELAEKLQMLSHTVFNARSYLFLLDDFEQNLPNSVNGDLSLSPPAEEILRILLRTLPNAHPKTRLIITCRYQFPLAVDHLHSISPDSFRGADLQKKIKNLGAINRLSDPEIRRQLIEAGRGNPRLLETLDTVVKESSGTEVRILLEKAASKKEEFVERLALQQLIDSQSPDFAQFLRHAAVFFAPALKNGIELVCRHISNWEDHNQKAVQLSLMEATHCPAQHQQFWITSILRSELFSQLPSDAQRSCHQAAVHYYSPYFQDTDFSSPAIAYQLLRHAVAANMPEETVSSGGRLLSYLIEQLSFSEALHVGEMARSILTTPVNNVDHSRFWSAFGSVLEYSGQSSEAIECFHLAITIDKVLYGEKSGNVATCLNNIGSSHESLGEYETARKYYLQSLDINRQINGARHRDNAPCLNNLGSVSQTLGNYHEAMDYYREALAIVEEEYGENHHYTARTINNLGVSYYSLGEYKEASVFFEKALDIYKSVWGDAHPDVANTLTNIGMVLVVSRDIKKAINYYEQALKIIRDVHNEGSPQEAVILNYLGEAYELSGDFDTAIDCQEQALEISRQFYGDVHPVVANCLNKLASHYQSLGDSQASIDLHARAYEVDRLIFDEFHPVVGKDLNSLGTAYHALGDLPEAIGYYEQALRIARTVFGERHTNVASILCNLGSAFDDLGKKKEALNHFKQAHDMMCECWGPDHPNTQLAGRNIQRLEEELGAGG